MRFSLNRLTIPPRTAVYLQVVLFVDGIYVFNPSDPRVGFVKCGAHVPSDLFARICRRLHADGPAFTRPICFRVEIVGEQVIAVQKSVSCCCCSSLLSLCLPLRHKSITSFSLNPDFVREGHCDQSPGLLI